MINLPSIPWQAIENHAPRDALQDPILIAILNILNQSPHSALIVGGAIRNLLRGDAITDIDIATSCTPDEVTHLLQRHNIKTIPTGVAHGTVTAVQDGRSFEITTLRRDVKTDGRHAKVAFGTNWNDDWQRRDFTFNALYANAKGDIYDPSRLGIQDLKAGYVRFIGDPLKRLQEDYLRLIRFFRFQALYGSRSPDEKLLAIIGKARMGLAKISGERIWRELIIILKLPDPVPILTLMAKCDILTQLGFVHAAKAMVVMQKLIDLEQKQQKIIKADPLLRLAILIGSPDSIKDSYLSFKFEKKIARKMEFLLKNSHHPHRAQSLRFLFYHRGRLDTQEWLAVHHALRNLPLRKTIRFMNCLQYYYLPNFPLTGHDLLQLHAAQGEAFGVLQRTLIDWWLENKGRPSKKECLLKAQDLITNELQGAETSK